MPIKNQTKRPQHEIEQAVKRFMAGESAVVLAKYYKVSKPGFYNWVSKYKQEMLDSSEKRDLSPKQQLERQREEVVAENMALKAENAKLRNKVVSLMIKAGDL